MCGIAGIFSVQNIEGIQKRIEKATEVVRHRGPDFQKFMVFSDKVALGHDRLKIIDLSDRANQPMQDSDGRYYIVFNGEIYNFMSIRNELHYSFQTSTDTETILAAVKEKGIRWFLKMANGMFAFAIYDSLNNEIILARDRFGIKPLFYYFDETKLLFASEIKAILATGLINPTFNEDAIDLYLANRYVYEPYTFFNEINEMRSGTFSEIRTTGSRLYMESEHYWLLPRMNASDSSIKDEELIISETEAKIKDAVKKRLIADVPLGTYLSGGVDSSLITAMVSLDKNEKVNTYTIGFEGDKFNEFSYARLVSNKYKTNHHEIIVDKKSYFDEWEKLMWYRDAPLGVPNEVLLSIMSRELKKEITVVLSGEGADELFGGYGRIFRLPFYFRNNVKNRTYYEEFINTYEYTPRRIRDKYLRIKSHELREKFDLTNQEIFMNYPPEESIFRFFHEYHIKGLLHRLDTSTMQASVEGRVPFLDHELVEFVYRKVPYKLKLKWKSIESMRRSSHLLPEQFSEIEDIPKYILKRVALNYLPKEIIEREKVGFPVPLTLWLDDLKQKAGILERAPWLKLGKFDSFIKEFSTTRRSGQILWMFINVEIFRRMYFQKNWKWW